MPMSEGDIAFEVFAYRDTLKRAKDVGLESLDPEEAIDRVKSLTEEMEHLRKCYKLLQRMDYR